MILTLQVIGTPAIKLTDYVREDTDKPRQWFRIIKIGATSTMYKCWTDNGFEFDIELHQGTPSYLFINNLLPSKKSPFSIEVKK